MYDGFDGYDAQAEGLYQQGGIDYSSPPDFNYKRLMGLGFSKIEIDTCQLLFQQGAKFTTSFLQQVCGYDYETASRIKYLYDIAQGKIEIETDDDLAPKQDVRLATSVGNYCRFARPTSLRCLSCV